MNPEDEQALLQVLRWARRPSYSFVHVLALMVVAGFIGRFV